MTHEGLLKRISKYGVVGAFAAAIHASILTTTNNFLPFWTSNLSGFLGASFLSYLGHSYFTFRIETNGKRFARRWLVIQFTVNLLASALLPIALQAWEGKLITTLFLVFTPTLLNALIWSKAASFSNKRQKKNNQVPYIHADDLGLTKSVNDAIFDLFEEGILDSASLLVNGTAVESAMQNWFKNKRLPLSLHICLTEGPTLADKDEVEGPINKEGVFNTSFSTLLLASILHKKVPFRRRLESKIECEIRRQIQYYKELTGLEKISIDGHQHIHLVPIVLDIILNLSKQNGIYWIRTTQESLPLGIPSSNWIRCFLQGGWLKWIVLQCLTILAKPQLRYSKIQTNSRFAGVLFSGRMVGKNFEQSIKELKVSPSNQNETKPLLLIHPSNRLTNHEIQFGLLKFPLSKVFFKSHWRQREWETAKASNELETNFK